MGRNSLIKVGMLSEVLLVRGVSVQTEKLRKNVWVDLKFI